MFSQSTKKPTVMLYGPAGQTLEMVDQFFTKVATDSIVVFCLLEYPLPRSYLRDISKILDGLPGVLCLMNVIVFGQDQKENDIQVKNAIVSLRE